MIPGTKMVIGGREFIIPPLNIRLLKKHQASLDELTSGEAVQKMGFSGYALKATPVLLENLQRNYPELTEDELLDLLPVGEVALVVRGMFAVSGFNSEAKDRPLDDPALGAVANPPV